MRFHRFFLLIVSIIFMNFHSPDPVKRNRKKIASDTSCKSCAITAYFFNMTGKSKVSLVELWKIMQFDWKLAYATILY